MRGPTETGEERAGGLLMRGGEGIKQVEAGNGAAGAVGVWNLGGIRGLFMRENECGTAGALDDTRGEDTDGAAMPAGGVSAIVVEDEAGRKAAGRGEQRLNLLFDLAQCVGFGGAAVVVQAVQLLGERARDGWIAGEKKLDDIACDLHAARGVEARREPEADVGGGDGPRGVDAGKLHQGA